MNLFDWKSELDRNEHHVVLSGQSISMHCHHYNINLQKTVEETLGDDGIRLLYRSAEEAAYSGLKSLLEQYRDIHTDKSKLEMAAMMYQNCGFGVIHLQDIKPGGGSFTSPSSHHVTGWLAKHGKRDTPGCHFTRGWVGGAMAAIFDRSPGYYVVEELQCKMMRAPECVFRVGEP